MEPCEKRNHVGESITTKKTAIHPVICGWEEIRLAWSILVPGRNLFLKSHHEGNMIAFNYPMTSAAMIKDCVGRWVHLRVWVLCDDSVSWFPWTLDGFHCCWVENLLHPRPLSIRHILRNFLFFFFEGMVQDVDSQQKAIVHDLEAFQHLSKKKNQEAHHSTGL